METCFIGADDTSDGARVASLVGSKAANLARIASLGLRVPPGFVLDTGACREAMRQDGRLTDAAQAVVRDAVARLERATRREFGGHPPLLVSVRSSPPISMPGMLDTVLNVGLTEPAARGLLRATGNPSLVWDTSRRFAQAFAETVLGCPSAAFAHATERVLAAAGAPSIDALDPLTLRDLARETAQVAHAVSGSPLPADPYAQLTAAIEAVFRSWSSPRASEYRRLAGVDDTTGTAVIVQTMAFGNGPAASGSGVGFTRNPSTGADELYVDFAFNAQGEDVVSGRHRVDQTASLAATLPDIDRQLRHARVELEAEFRDMQDFEFTVQDGELFFLQSRAGKRTPWAALHIAVDLVGSGLIGADEALQRLAPYDLPSLQRVRPDVTPGTDPIASAVPAATGVAVGAIALDCDRARSLALTQPVILVRPDLTTDDIAGLSVAAGIVTARGGRTSHAAVVARHLGKVCLAGCSSLRVDEGKRRCSFGARAFAEGDVITVDGDSGLIYSGAVPTVIERPACALAEVQRWREMRTS